MTKLDFSNLVLGAEFFRVSPDEFATISKAANEKGLMALIFELDGKAGDPDMKISFELIEEGNTNEKS